MQDQVNATPKPKRVPWNKGKLTGAKPPLRPKHVWPIRRDAGFALWHFGAGTLRSALVQFMGLCRCP
jgi:hypothetical protein